MSERNSELSVEQVSKISNIAREIKRNNLIGDDSDEAAERARKLISNPNFFPSQYESVEQMINLSNDPGRPEDDVVKKNARNSLDILGAAILVAGEGKIEELACSAKLSENLSSTLQGIEISVGSNLLVRDENDEVGKFIVHKLIEAGRVNIKAQRAPNIYGGKAQEEGLRGVADQLMDKRDELPEDSLDALKVDAVIGYLDESIKPRYKNSEVEKQGRRREGEIPTEAVRPDKKSENDSDGREDNGYTRNWELDADHMAQAMKFMAGDMRWSDWTPPEWFKKLENGTDKEQEEAYRISVMATICNAASNTAWAGKDLEKIMGNKDLFSFTHENMTKLFNKDFKLVMSKMFHDLCELKPDQNGRLSIRYKEGWETDEHTKKEYWTIKKSVTDKISNIKNYEDDLALFLAKDNGRTEANAIDKMNAYTAWNLFYATGGSSLADRMRILPTYNNVICDAIRTLNPEYKALGKWQVKKGGKEKGADDLFDAEYFSGPMADYVLTIMKMERDLAIAKGEEGSIAIDGKKTLRDKILSGEMSILANKTFYGFFDFVHGNRDLFQGEYKKGEEPLKFYDNNEGVKTTLAEQIWNYAEFDKDGELIKKNGSEFNFGGETVTFMNEYFDSLDAATLIYTCTMGKAKVENPAVWARTLKDKFGMVNGIKINGERAFSYSDDPRMWRDLIIGSFGVDMRRLSTDHICMMKDSLKSGVEQSYSLYVHDMLSKVFKLSDTDLNINELMRLLGVDVKDGEDPSNLKVALRNDKLEIQERIFTRSLRKEVREGFDYSTLKSKVIKENGQLITIKPEDLIAQISRLRAPTKDEAEDFNRLKRDFQEKIKAGNLEVARRIVKRMEDLYI
jgi:hypothetical protein